MTPLSLEGTQQSLREPTRWLPGTSNM